jgi:drug/metabolite transporter (DMT)-like permease
MLVAIVFTLPASIIELQYKPCTFTLPAVLSILYLAVVCTALAHNLWNKSLSMIDASTCYMLYPLQPLTSAVMGVLLLHEKLTLNYIIGAILISVGIVIALVRVNEKIKATADM